MVWPEGAEGFKEEGELEGELSEEIYDVVLGFIQPPHTRTCTHALALPLTGHPAV